MNLLLHGIGLTDDEAEPPVSVDNALRADLGDRFTLVLTNPPFGRNSSVRVINGDGREERQALTEVRADFWTSTSRKQLNFIKGGSRT